MSTIKEIIEEAIKEYRKNIFGKDGDGEVPKEIAEKYASKLQPATSPEELEVWVDGKKVGYLFDSIFEPLQTGLVMDVGDPESGVEDIRVDDHHIQIINSRTGEVIMDNRQTKDQ
jgi:hypothetical protein